MLDFNQITDNALLQELLAVMVRLDSIMADLLDSLYVDRLNREFSELKAEVLLRMGTGVQPNEKLFDKFLETITDLIKSNKDRKTLKKKHWESKRKILEKMKKTVKGSSPKKSLSR